MTTRELRSILSEVDNQEMTIKDLRELLFEIDEQDEELTENKMARITRTASKAK